MKFFATILLGLLLSLSASAGTFDCQWIFRDTGSNVIAIKEVLITPIAPYGVDSNNIIITGDRKTYRSDSVGSLIVSNLFNGRSYRVQITGPQIQTTFTNSFDTNVTGLVNGADSQYLTAPIRDGSVTAYSRTESDRKFHDTSGDTSTNAAFRGTFKIPAGASVGKVLTVTNANGEAAWQEPSGGGAVTNNETRAITFQDSVTAELFTGNGGGLTNVPGVSPSNVIHVSKWPGVTAFTGDVDVGIGPDSGPAIQAILDQATNGPIKVVVDDKFLFAQTLRTRSYTEVVGLTRDCGLVLSNNCNQWMMVCAEQNGNAYTTTNIALRNMTFYGNSSNQVHHTTPASPYYVGNYSPVSSTNPVAPITGGGVDYWEPWLMGVWFSGVDGLIIEDVTVHNSECFAITVGGSVKNAYIQRNKLFWTGADEANQDGIHVFGPFDGLITDTWSNGNDDTIALNIDELSYVTNASMRIWRGTNGNCGNIIVKNPYHDRFSGGLIRLLAYNSDLGNNFVTNLTISGVRGRFTPNHFICGPINSTWGSGKMYVQNLLIDDVSVENSPVAIDLIGVSGRAVTINNVVGYGSPSYYSSSFTGWDLGDRNTPSYLYFGGQWDDININNCRFYTTSSETNVALVGTRYHFGAPGIKNLSINNSSISGPGIRTFLANHGTVDTVTFNGVTTTNRQWIPGAYTARTVAGDLTPRLRNPIGMTNYAEDTTLWLRRVRQLGYEPTPSRLRAIDWGLQFLAASGDLVNMPEMGFYGGATNINEILPKIRTHYTNEFGTNGFHINNGFDNADLSRFGVVGDGASYLDTQVSITTNGIGAAWYTNLSVGVYLQTIATTNQPKSYAGPSYAGGDDNKWFSFQSWSPVDSSTPTMLLGNLTYGPITQLQSAGLHSFTTTSPTARNIYASGVIANTTTGWNGRGLTNGTFLIGKGQYYGAATNVVISGWYVGNSSVNQSNVNYAFRTMTEMAACYSPMTIYTNGFTNYFGTTASVFVTGGTSVSVTNHLGQQITPPIAATNVTFTLNANWVIGGANMTGTATEISQ